MAPILKEADASVATTTTSAPAAPLAKSPTEPAARPQPVPLEIPVTVNGARTVDGSAKREPFSETTQTVLVFPLGAVIRIATPLYPGQLVFLTNEKSKKEVVCQVIKSKSGGTTSGYVELQFTEPAPGFWGLQVSGSPVPPPAPRPLVAPAPSAPKAGQPVPPLPARPVSPRPPVPAPILLAPAKLPLAPPAPSVAKPEPAAPQTAAPAVPVSPISVVPPPVAAILEARLVHSAEPVKPSGPHAVLPVMPPVPAQSTPAGANTSGADQHLAMFPSNFPPPPAEMPPASSAIPAAPAVPAPAISVPALHDYSKEISALFAVPHAPISETATPAVPDSIPAPSPSSEELKLQAVRLQAQLSSLLFTETPVPPVAAVPPVSPATESSADEVAVKVLEIAHNEPDPVAKAEPRPALPARKPIPPPLAADEEVRIPSWLAPLSQNSQSSIVEPAASGEVASDSSSAGAANPEDSGDNAAVDGPHRSHTAVFSGQLLGESSTPDDLTTSTSSKKGLFLALAAATLLLIGGGAWYYQKNYSRPATVAPARPAGTPSSAVPAPVSDLSAARHNSTPAISTVNPPPIVSSSVSSKSSKNTEPAPTPAVFTPAPEHRNSEPVARNAQPVEHPKKPTLGDVHLASPVVNRGGDAPQDGEPLPSIQTGASPAGADLLAAVGGIHHKGPVAPLPVGGDVKPAQLLKSVAPIYPQIARSQRISGNVQLDAFIDPSGNVASVKVLSGPPVLHNAALQAVKQWKYSPALLDGQPTSMHLTVTVQFRTQ